MAKKRINTKTSVKIKAYPIIDRAVEEGVLYGYNRAFKHTESPGEAEITEQIHTAVMNVLCEILDFESEYD